MDKTISIAWFYVMCCTIIILFILVVVLSIALCKMKKKQYKQLHEEGNIVTTINSNRFSIQFQNRKPSDELLRVYADFNTDQVNAQTKTNHPTNKNNERTENNNKKNTTESEEEICRTARNNNEKAKVLISPLVQQQIDAICSELLQLHAKGKKESIYGLKGHNKNRNKSDLVNTRAISMSTPELYDILPNTSQVETLNISVNKDSKCAIRDSRKEMFEIPDLNKTKRKSTVNNVRKTRVSSLESEFYDVLPSKAHVQPVNVYTDEDGQYSIPKSESTVVLDDESGYLLPLSFGISYVNAN